MTIHRSFVFIPAIVLVVLSRMSPATADPLPSWKEGSAKKSIITFVEKVTTEASPDFVPVAERIAVFDNDGTLWCEKPVPVQLFFALDRVRALAPQNPEWKEKEPFASLLKGDLQTAASGGEHAIMELFMATHTGMTTVEFEKMVKDWISTAKHPTTGKRFHDMTYQPMLEVLAYLRAHGFKNYIVSGGGIEFIRPWAEVAYGIPPEQVIGSSVKTKFELRDGQPVIVRLPELNFNDDKGGKPVGINQHIGRRPIAAFGNSDGDLQMLQYTGAGSGLRFCLYVHHDDTDREYAYDRADKLARLDKGLDEATANGWTIASMKDDWTTIFATVPPPVTAIDVLLQPDATMLKHAAANNSRLREEFPSGFSLDADHTPHITMLQCFVRTEELDRVYAAVEKVLADTQIDTMKLEAFKYYYAPGGQVGVAGICAKPTPQILILQARIIEVLKPFMVENATINAFTAPHHDPAMDAALISYVTSFASKMDGENFNPHVSTGVAPIACLDAMLAEPFEEFTFSAVGAAVYQLGPFGTAARKLKVWDLQP